MKAQLVQNYRPGKGMDRNSHQKTAGGAVFIKNGQNRKIARDKEAFQ